MIWRCEDDFCGWVGVDPVSGVYDTTPSCPLCFRYAVEVDMSRVEDEEYICESCTEDEIDDLPEQHEARKNPNLMVERTDTLILDGFPPLAKVTNRGEVLFGGADPLVKDSEDFFCPAHRRERENNIE